jgi:hypothetical protein
MGSASAHVGAMRASFSPTSAMVFKIPALLMLTHSPINRSLAVCASSIVLRLGTPVEDGASQIHVLIGRSAPGLRARAAMDTMTVDGRPRTCKRADAERALPCSVLAPGRSATCRGTNFES